MKRSNSNTNSSSITTDWMTNLVTLPQLLDMDFPPPSWLVPNVIPQGLTLLAGRPKAGKSFFALEVSLAVASGGYAFGSNKHQCGQGKVLYCALAWPYEIQDAGSVRRLSPGIPLKRGRLATSCSLGGTRPFTAENKWEVQK